MASPRIHIFNSIEHHLINLDNVMYIKSDGNYCSVHLTDGTEILNIPKQLGQVARLINQTELYHLSGKILQVGRYHIVNTDHIQSIYLCKKQIIFNCLSSSTTHHPCISPSYDSLSRLCDYITNKYCQDIHYSDHTEENQYWSETDTHDDGILILGH